MRYTRRTINLVTTLEICVTFALEMELISVLGIVTNLITTTRGLSGIIGFSYFEFKIGLIR